MTIPALTVEGHLPVGRYPCTPQEVHRRFVAEAPGAGESRRGAIWSDWQGAQDYVRSRVPVRRAWFGGSFVSGAASPQDLDVVLLVDGETFETLGEDVKAEVAVFGMGPSGKDLHGLVLDSFIVRHATVLKPGGRGTDERADLYCWMRGRWDDFWQRLKTSGTDEAALVRAASPQRGYLEVVLDG